MRKFNLVQRGKFRDELVRDTTKIQGLLGGRGHNLIDPDYMGSSEFEYGAIPYAYRRFMRKRDNYVLLNLKDVISLSNVNGVPFWTYVNKEDVNDAIEAMTDYILDLRARDKIRSWRLRERTDIELHLDRLTFAGRTEKPDSNFWWCIDDREDYVCDWFMFVGAKDRVNAFLAAIEYDYNNWWVNLSAEEQSKIRR